MSDLFDDCKRFGVKFPKDIERAAEINELIEKLEGRRSEREYHGEDKVFAISGLIRPWSNRPVVPTIGLRCLFGQVLWLVRC
jgi:hypothetical protein